jgi:hypothetical protein
MATFVKVKKEKEQTPLIDRWLNDPAPFRFIDDDKKDDKADNKADNK